MKKTNDSVINDFRGQYRFLSNFYPCEILYNGQTYPSSEHAYQAAKFFDLETQTIIRETETAGRAKILGRSPGKRKDWDTIRISIMNEILNIKFSNPVLAKMLLATGDAELIEGNTWRDKFWGVYEGEGENNLGKLLMKIRSRLKERNANEIDDTLFSLFTGETDIKKCPACEHDEHWGEDCIECFCTGRGD